MHNKLSIKKKKNVAHFKAERTTTKKPAPLQFGFLMTQKYVLNVDAGKWMFRVGKGLTMYFGKLIRALQYHNSTCCFGVDLCDNVDVSRS